MPDAPNPPSELRQRLEDRARAWLVAQPWLSRFALRERDENGLLNPEEAPTRPVIIIEAEDEGRATSVDTPIRNIRLKFTVRANAKTPAGSAESFSAVGGSLENLIEAANLKQVLSGPTIAVMLAKRTPGIGMRCIGLVREGTLSIEVKAVAMERTTG